MPLPFREVITKTQQALKDKPRSIAIDLPVQFEHVDHEKDQKRFAFLRRADQLRKVQYFAISPIVIGDEFWGVISCATDLNLKLSELEQNAIQTVMQLVAISIGHFDRVHDAKRLTDLLHDQLFGATQIEITQATRHELENIEAIQTFQIRNLKSQIEQKAKTEVTLQTVSDIQKTLGQLTDAISRLRYSSVAIAPDPQKTSIKAVWDDAARAAGRSADHAADRSDRSDRSIGQCSGQPA